MRKTPYFGFASLLVLAVGAAAVIVFLLIDAPGNTDPADDSLAILVDGLGQLIYAAIFTAGAALVSVIFSVISLLRGEGRVPAVICLLICIPILVYLGLAVIGSMAVG